MKQTKKILKTAPFLCFMFLAADAQAQLIKSDCSGDGEGCQLSDLAQVAINATTILLSITGAVALLAFIYGGFLFLISSGNSDMVSKGKSAIKGAVIGMLIVFLSFTIITLVFRALGIEGNWWESNWFS